MASLRLELRQLASFVLACQNPTITETAEELGIASSTLSVGLRSLEDMLEMKLFERSGGHLSPLPSAFWLFQKATALLHAESFARSVVRRPAGSTRRLHVGLDLSFSIGRFTKAVSRTIQKLHEHHPEYLIEFDFIGGSLPVYGNPSVASADRADARVHIGYLPTKSGNEPGSMRALLDDRWVAIGSSDVDFGFGNIGPPLLVVTMRPELVEAITAHAERNGFADRLSRSDAEPADLASLLSSGPSFLVLMPRSMVSDRLGLVHPHIHEFEPPLVSTIGARTRGRNLESADLFTGMLGDALQADEANAVFRPQMTARQIHYFNLVQQCGGISAAARAANVTQPSLSSQIKKMESAVGKALFLRNRSGSESTRIGRRLVPRTLEIEARIEHIQQTRRDVAAHTQDMVSVGIFPTSGHDSPEMEQVAGALATLIHRHPHLRFRVVEATDVQLHAQVDAGELNLAIVSQVQPHTARISLCQWEPLSIVTNPALGLGDRSEITLAEACALPLVLGSKSLSSHRAFSKALLHRRLVPDILVETGSLALAIAMVRQAPLGTVLPASVVRQDLQAGLLTATPLSERVVSGNLAVIFSGDRSLSEAERMIVSALSDAFVSYAAERGWDD